MFGTDGARAWIEGLQKQANQKEEATANGSNPDYDFELRKSAGSNGPFSIYNVTPRRKPDNDGYALSFVTGQAKNICRAFPLDFSRFISSPDFRVLNATEVVRDGDRLVQIEFAYHLKNPRPDEKMLVGRYTGTVCFAPDSYWAITDAKLKLEDDPSKEVSAIDTHNKIAKALGGIPVIVETSILWYDLKGNLFQRRTQKREWKEYTGGDERFTLSVYGFPELAPSQPSKTRLWYLGISVAFAFFFIVMFIYRRWQSARTRRTNPSSPGEK